MEHRLDPLGDLEVKRVLAFARAREQYPSLPRGLLLDYCQAAWQAALAGGESDDAIGRFERALVLVAWTHRRSPDLSLRSLVDVVIPQVALRPFMAPGDAAAAEAREPAPVLAAEPAAKRDAVRTPARRLIPRVPFASPVPLGAAAAAGFIGVTILGQAGALPLAPFAPAGNDDASSGDGGHAPGASVPAGRSGAVGQASSVPRARIPPEPSILPEIRSSIPRPRAAAERPAEAGPGPRTKASARAPEAVAPLSAPTDQKLDEAPALPHAGPTREAPAAVEGGASWTQDMVDEGTPSGDAKPAPTAPRPTSDLALPDPGDPSAPSDATGEGRGRGQGGAPPRQPDHFEPSDLGRAGAQQGQDPAPAPAGTPAPATTQPGGTAQEQAAAPAAQPDSSQQAASAAPPPPEPARVGPPPAQQGAT